MKRGVAAGALALVVAGVSTLTVVRLVGSARNDAAIELVPSGSYLYANLFISPSNGQKRALDDLLGRFPKIESTEAAIDTLTGLLDEQLAEIGLDYRTDVKPWLGDQISLFVSGDGAEAPAAAALVETTDPDAAAETIDKITDDQGTEAPERKSYEGVDYEVDAGAGSEPTAAGFVDDFLVVGTEVGFKSVVDTSRGEESLTSSPEFEDAFEGLDEDNLFSLFVDQGRLFKALQEGGDLDPETTAMLDAFPGLFEAGTSAVVLAARDDGVVLQASGAVPEDDAFKGYAALFKGTDLLSRVPSDAWLALGVPKVGDAIRGFFDVAGDLPGAEDPFPSASEEFRRATGLDLDEDVLSWMGDAALFVQGNNLQELGGALILETTDEAGAEKAVGVLRDALEKDGAPTADEQRGGFEGFSIRAGLPAPIYALVEDRVIVSYGDRATDDAIEPGETLGDDPLFREATDALGDGYVPALFVDLDEVAKLVDFAQSFSGESDQTFEQQVKPWLDPLSFFIAGSRQDGDRIFQTYFVGVDPEGA